MRVKLTLSYNGSAFEGSQQQLHTGHTVMGTLHAALMRLQIDTKLVASGRTDRGVHATGQVVHCDLPEYWSDLCKLRRSLSHQLPSTIHIRHIEHVSDAFHARYSAKRRVYRYILSDEEPNPFEADFITFVPSLDFERISEAIPLFVGTHDFTYFKKNGSDVTHYVRTVYKAFAYRHRGKTILYFEANGYLRSQIRLMVGFVLQISEGKLTTGQLREQLALEAHHAIRIAPHNGLYLARIKY